MSRPCVVIGTKRVCIAATPSSFCCTSTTCVPSVSHRLFRLSTSFAPGQLLAQLAIVVRGQHVEVVDAALELLDELEASANAGQLAHRVPRRVRQGVVADLVPSSTVAILLSTASHLRFELWRAAQQRCGAFAKRLERRAIRRELVAQLRGFRVRLVELADLGGGAVRDPVATA